MKKHLPAVHEVLHAPCMDQHRSVYGELAVAEAIRAVQEHQRTDMKSNRLIDEVDPASYVGPVRDWLLANRTGGYRRVFNLTGIILHSNLGRALLSKEIFSRIADVAVYPTTLEFNTQTGKRGNRDATVRERLVHLIGCESATVVNNNAAALMLVVNSLARGKFVIVSRSELIEIGGSFRLPDIIRSAGCELREVGTTNRTHLRDYENAISDDVGLILKVHQSNFRITGFTNEVETADLSNLAKVHGVPLAVDLGSGALVNLQRFNLPSEPQPQQVLTQGADLVTFSGDKLLGGPQAGLVVGSEELIQILNSNPLKRAIRLDKVALALLDETLKVYETPDKIIRELPLYRTISASKRILQHRANTVCRCLEEKLPDFVVGIEPSTCELGSGSLPDHHVESLSVNISHIDETETLNLNSHLRSLSTPILARINQGKIKLDMIGADPLEDLCEVLGEIS